MNRIHNNTLDTQDLTYNFIFDLLVIQSSLLTLCLEEGALEAYLTEKNNIYEVKESFMLTILNDSLKGWKWIINWIWQLS